MTNSDKDVISARDWIRMARTVLVFAVMCSFVFSLMYGTLIYTVGLLLGTIAAWSKEKVGGIIIIVVAIALMIWVTIWPHTNPSVSFPEMLFYGGPPLLAGVLFLLGDRKAKREAAGF
jgi:hypothetical protein